MELEGLKAQSNVIMTDHGRVPDIYPLLPHIDCMITDYSSIFFDFLLLDRPLLFFPYDYNKFIENKGRITFNYFDQIPGPKIYSGSAFQEYIKLLSNGRDPHASEREELLDRMHYFQDGQATERSVEILHDLCEHEHIEYHYHKSVSDNGRDQ
jgi:CDP-glycerol glycerophosphotransferase (TagB/SpsB family)